MQQNRSWEMVKYFESTLSLGTENPFLKPDKTCRKIIKITLDETIMITEVTLNE